MQSFKPNMQTKVAGGTVVAYTAVKYSGDGETVVTCGAGEDACGIAQSGGASGADIEVAMPGGGAKWIAGETIAAGAKLCKSDASGFAVKASDGSRVVGVMDSPGLVLNDVGPAFVSPSIAGAAQS